MTENHIWHLVSRKLSGEASQDELWELQQLLKDDPEMAYRVELYSSYFDEPLPPQRTEDQQKDAWQKLQSRLQEEFQGSFGSAQEPVHSLLLAPAGKKRSNRKWMVVAMSAAAILILFLSIRFLGQRPQAQQPLAANAASVNEMKTMPGTRSKTVLPDGTTVWLNSGSRITYNADFGQTKREVSLTGEAYFDVAHNEAVPMVVHAKNVNIWVKGTAFNVKSYPESKQVETSLIRGSVELTTNQEPERKILLRPNEKIVVDALAPTVQAEAALPAKQPQATAQQESDFHIAPLKESRFNIIPEISWVENRLVFDNESFPEVISKMEKWYNVEIILENKDLATRNFSGAFEKEDIATALEALQFTNHFEFDIKGNRIYIK